jgi:peptidyl-prolyl cis-trans isomerase D
MLNSMRQYATSWVVKVLLGLLIVSFAVWGIGDVLRSPGTGGALASVASEEVTTQEVMREFEARYEALQEQAGGGLSRHQAVSFGLMNQALDVAVARALVDAHARDLGLAVSDAELAEAVRRNPLFQGEAGGFERERLDLYLRSQGLSEQAYLEAVRGDMVRARIVEAATGPVTAPAALADKLLAHRDEQRRGRALIVDADEIPVDAPDEATLKAYLERNAKQYEAPEYRAVTAVVIGPDDLAGDVAVDEADLRAEYEARIAEYRTPETRSIDQLVAGDEATIREAAALAASGQGFEQVAAALKGKGGLERTQLGPLRRGDLPEALDAAVFGLAEGAVGEPVSSPFGWHLIRLTELLPEKTRPFEEVREDLEREVRLRRANEQLPGFATRLDDEIAAGTPLERAAESLGVAPLRLEAIDRQGQDKKGVAVAADRLTPEILDAVFAAGRGEQSLLSETRDDRYYMFRVDGIEPARPRTLDEVRDVLAAAWRKEQQAERAKARAEELRAKVADSAFLAGAAASAGHGVGVAEVGPVKRGDQGYLAGLTPEAVEAMFETPAGATAPRVVPALEGWAVLVVDEVILAAADPAAAQAAREELARDIRTGVLQAYESALRQRYPVRVDDRQLAQMMESQAQ